MAKREAKGRAATPPKKGLGLVGWVLVCVAVFFAVRVGRRLLNRGAPAPPQGATGRPDPQAIALAEERAADGDRLLADGDPDGAAKALTEALALYRTAGADDPSMARARRSLGRALLGGERYGELEEKLEAWRPLYAEAIWVAEDLAALQLRRGLLADALRTVEGILARRPGHAPSLRRRLEILTRMRAAAAIPAAVDEALAADPQGRETRLAGVRALLAVRDYDRLLPVVEPLLAGAPDDPLLRFARGVALARTDALDRAERDLEAARHDEALGADVEYELGHLQIARGRIREALRIFGRMLVRDPLDTRAAVGYAAAAKRLGLEDHASLAEAYTAEIRAAETGKARADTLEQAGRPVEAAVARAAHLELLCRIREAEEVLEAASRRFPDDPRPRLALAEAELYRGTAAEALRALEGLGTAEADRLRGRALAKVGRRDEGVAALERAAADPAVRAEAALELGEVALEEPPRPLEAVAWFEEALERFPAAARFGLARARYALGDLEAALEAVEAAGAAGGSFPLTTWKARILAGLGRTEEAREALSAAPTAERGGTVYLEARASVLRAAKDPGAAEASRALERARALDAAFRRLERELAGRPCPEAAETLVALAGRCERRGAVARATHYALLAADCDPENPEAPRIVAGTSRHAVLAFRELHWVERRLVLVPGDEEAAARCAELRVRLALVEPAGEARGEGEGRAGGGEDDGGPDRRDAAGPGGR